MNDIEKLQQRVKKLEKTIEYLKKDSKDFLNYFPHYLSRFTPDGRFVYTNKVEENITKEDFLASNYFDYFTGKEKIEAKQRIRELAQTGKSIEYSSKNVIVGEIKYFQNICWRSSNKNNEYVINQIATEVTSKEKLTKELEIRSNNDYLTKLNNRYWFEEKLNQKLYNIKTLTDSFYVSYFDLDDFKIVNDTCGHKAGDHLLVKLAETLKSTIVKSTMLARIGGDEFALLFQEQDIGYARLYIEKVRKAIEDMRFVWEGQTFQVTGSFGLIELLKNDDNTSIVMQDVDMATYFAKSKGGNQIHVFQAEDNLISGRKLELNKVLQVREAIENNRVVPYAQKILPTNNKKGLFSIEILARIEKQKKVILAGSFIKVAEQYNFIQKIDEMILIQTLEFFEKDLSFLKELDYLAINLSGKSVSQKGFLRFVLDTVNKTTVPHSKILFEITETSAISDLNSITIFMNKLCKMGCRFALDDFGSGFSSFKYLRDLPAEVLKIDGSFIDKINDGIENEILIDGMTQLGKRMGKKVVAENVENKQALKKLQNIHVDFVQGYYLHHPQPLNSLFS